MTNLNKKTSDFVSEGSEVQVSKQDAKIRILKAKYEDLIKSEGYESSNAQLLDSLLPKIQETFKGIVESKGYKLEDRMTGDIIRSITSMAKTAHKNIADKQGECKMLHEQLTITPNNLNLETRLSSGLNYQDALEAQIVIYDKMLIVAEISYLNTAGKMYVPYTTDANVIKIQQKSDTMARYEAKVAERKARMESYCLKENVLQAQIEKDKLTK
jgi:hypothetical protein